MLESAIAGLICLLAIIGGYLAGFGFLIWFVFRQIKLEQNYFERYGQGWEAEYQKYHGSLMQAHLKIAICLLALAAITLVGFWFFRSGRKRNKD